MLKRMISLILGGLLITTAVSAVEIKSCEVNNENNLISVEYDYEASNVVSVLVYDVTGEENPTIETNYVDTVRTPIIQLSQEWGDGSFELKLKESYSGKAILIVGSSDDTHNRVFLEVEEGVVKYITLSNGKSMDVESAQGLASSVVDTNGGTLKIGTTDVQGTIRFNANGEIAAKAGDSITMESAPDENGKRNIGFIEGRYFESPESVTLTIAHEKANPQSITYENTSIYSGMMLFGAIVKGVPETVSTEDFVVTIE